MPNPVYLDYRQDRLPPSAFGDGTNITIDDSTYQDVLTGPTLASLATSIEISSAGTSQVKLRLNGITLNRQQYLSTFSTYHRLLETGDPTRPFYNEENGHYPIHIPYLNWTRSAVFGSEWQAYLSQYMSGITDYTNIFSTWYFRTGPYDSLQYDGDNWTINADLECYIYGVSLTQAFSGSPPSLPIYWAPSREHDATMAYPSLFCIRNVQLKVGYTTVQGQTIQTFGWNGGDGRINLDCTVHFASKIVTLPFTLWTISIHPTNGTQTYMETDQVFLTMGESAYAQTLYIKALWPDPQHPGFCIAGTLSTAPMSTGGNIYYNTDFQTGRVLPSTSVQPGGWCIAWRIRWPAIWEHPSTHGIEGLDYVFSDYVGEYAMVEEGWYDRSERWPMQLVNGSWQSTSGNGAVIGTTTDASGNALYRITHGGGKQLFLDVKTGEHSPEITLQFIKTSLYTKVVVYYGRRWMEFYWYSDGRIQKSTRANMYTSAFTVTGTRIDVTMKEVVLTQYVTTPTIYGTYNLTSDFASGGARITPDFLSFWRGYTSKISITKYDEESEEDIVSYYYEHALNCFSPIVPNCPFTVDYSGGTEWGIWYQGKRWIKSEGSQTSVDGTYSRDGERDITVAYL